MIKPEPLHILLTNDDGHEAPGIQTLYRALKQSDHRVSLVAPSSERSATGMSITTRSNMPVVQLEEGIWHVDGHPADSVQVALHHLLHEDPPDIVLSGINFGPNLGIFLHASGTIGAALMALLNGLPAIAVSAGMHFSERELDPRPFPSTHEVLEPAAEFTLSVIDALLASHLPGKDLLPAGVLLNINYPALPADVIRGVLYPKVSDDRMIQLRYDRCDETGHAVPKYIRSDDRVQDRDGDIHAHMEGYITVSAIKPNWNAPEELARDIRSRLSGL
jgi:5'-nucleotidase